ncbi:PadR family transcriptional regulator [Fulvimonas sp. R45]|jgi:DNA-binding PadR family transcriptional regulator|uniref:PadR family transcriptional regulator n=1 Tax=Fulvimonas sp. R45 TaxID=3045937 RepID=UPI00265F563D|nr:PadR family transcriptional regulator [Fulvimonas sp. R45]MDO1530059.1 PadR family transcriptional regulator [Fulvimonas sp. R45]
MHMRHHFFRAMHQRFHHGFGCDGPYDSDHHARHAGRGPFGRHGHGDDAFAAWNGLRGGGRHGGGRMFGHGDLKLLLLALIEQQPRHGYELIRTIEEMFHGQYSPSPGAIYPTLTMLEELGHVEVQSEQGNRKLYAITDAGRAFLDENRAAVEAVTARTEHSARMAAKMAAPMTVRKAMHALKHAMLMRTDWDKAEAERVAAILQRAASEIAAGGRKD